jgi:hypothetical protein
MLDFNAGPCFLSRVSLLCDATAAFSLSTKDKFPVLLGLPEMCKLLFQSRVIVCSKGKIRGDESTISFILDRVAGHNTLS